MIYIFLEDQVDNAQEIIQGVIDRYDSDNFNGLAGYFIDSQNKRYDYFIVRPSRIVISSRLGNLPAGLLEYKEDDPRWYCIDDTL